MQELFFRFYPLMTSLKIGLENFLILIVPDLTLRPDILEHFSQKSLVSLKEEHTKMKIINNLSDTFLSGFPAKQVSYNHKEGKLKLFSHCIWAILECNAYILCWSAMRKDKSRYQPIFERMADSFKITS